MRATNSRQKFFQGWNTRRRQALVQGMLGNPFFQRSQTGERETNNFNRYLYTKTWQKKSHFQGDYAAACRKKSSLILKLFVFLPSEGLIHWYLTFVNAAGFPTQQHQNTEWWRNAHHRLYCGEEVSQQNLIFSLKEILASNIWSI